MEITMTLTVTPEQAAAIADLLAGNKPTNQPTQALQSTPPPATPSQPAPVTVPTQSLQSTPLPTAPSQPAPVAAPQPMTAAVNAAAPVQRQEPLPTGIPTQVPTYTVQDLCLACRPLMEAGKQAELQALLTEFGASAGIAAIPENRRSDFAARIRSLGGQI